MARVKQRYVLTALATVSVTALAAHAQDSKPEGSGGIEQSIPVSNDPFFTEWTPAPEGGEITKLSSEPVLLPKGSYEVVEGGYRRVHRTDTRMLTPEEIAALLAAGKVDGLRGGELITQTFSDYLPEDWMSALHDVPFGVRVDSYGNPIVNQTSGLPDWAQRDVDALRAEIDRILLHLQNLELALGGKSTEIAEIPARLNLATYGRDVHNLRNDYNESQRVLGNYLAQAFVRQIPVDDMITLSGDAISSITAGGIADYVRFYESTLAHEIARAGEGVYVPSVYSDELTSLLGQYGYAIDELLDVEAEEEVGRGAGDCYNRANTPVGMTTLSGATNIWNGANGTYDDSFSDIALPYRYYFEPCNDADSNFNVRVSTNGYVSFFEQGGDATNGTAFDNQALPFAGSPSPNGFAAPWWDDLEVRNQGVPDEVRYKVEGSVGFRVFTIEYYSMSHYLGGINEFYYFQVRFWENYPRVDFHYDSGNFADTDESRTSGLENFTGTAANCENCSNTISAMPTTNYQFDYPQASNDGCSSPTCIEENQPIFGSNFGAGGSELSSCGINDYSDVFYVYHAPITATVTATLCSGGNGYDSTISVFAGTACTNAGQVGCNDDFCGLRAQTNFEAVAGTTYTIRVSGYQQARGTFVLNLNLGAFGDECYNPHQISMPGTGANYYGLFDNTGCSDQTTCASNDTIDEWLSWTAPQSGLVHATTCDGDTNFDTTLAIYTGICPNLTQIACNDDAAPFCNGQLTSRVAWQAVAGTTYLFRVAGYDGTRGDYDIEFHYSTCPADIDGSGDNVVNLFDLLELLSNWNTSSLGADLASPTDIVNLFDLLELLSSWGACN